MIRSPIKRVLSLSLLGLVILAACSRPPMQEQTNTSLPLSNSPPINLSAALTQAKAENKLVFMDFTGSDWCPPCMELEKKVFSQADFQAYAASNLVFLSVNFPLKFRLTPEANATNNLLAQQFKVDGPPILIALNGDGKEIWRHIGPYETPKELIADLAAAKAK
jgi:thiol:disulfide interchange protein